MQKLYKIVMVLMLCVATFTQTQAQVANCCAECQADVKAIADKQVLLEKIEIPKGSVMTNGSANVYVSYQSGNPQKFWTNLAIATAGIAVSTQLGSSSTPITAGDSRTQGSSVSPAIPLGVSAALIPSIWKNRPRGVPNAGLYVQHRDLKGKLTQSWEQPISNEAKNSAELLTVAIDKPLSEGTLEVYLQNGSKNEVFYWGLQTVKNLQIEENDLPLQSELVSLLSTEGCPQGSLSNGKGQCYNSINKNIVTEKTKLEPLILTREIQPVGSKMSTGLGQFSLKKPPLPPITPATAMCWDWYYCQNGMCEYMFTSCENTVDGGGGGGGGDSPWQSCPSGQTYRADFGRCLTDYEYGRLLVRRQECLYQHQQFNLNVTMARSNYEIDKIACNDALNSSIIDALIEWLRALLLSGGDTSSYGDPGDIEDYVNCRDQADGTYSRNIDKAYADMRDAEYRLACANLY